MCEIRLPGFQNIWEQRSGLLKRYISCLGRFVCQNLTCLFIGTTVFNLTLFSHCIADDLR